MTNSNGRNIAIVTGSALGLGYELTKRLIADIAATGHIDLLINNAGQPSFKTPTAYEASDVDRCLKGLKGTSVRVVGVYPGGIDTAFYRDSRDYVSEEKHLHGSGRTGPSDPVQSGQRREPDRLRHPHRTQLPLSRMGSAGSAAMQVALLRARRLSDPRAACTGPCR